MDKDKDKPVKQLAPEAGLQQSYKVLDYLSGMHYALALVDAVVCCAGAATMAESSTLGLPALYAPLPVDDGGQSLSASSVAGSGGVLLLNQKKTKPTEAAVLIKRILDPAKDPEMRQATASAGITKGVANLAKLIQEVL